MEENVKEIIWTNIIYRAKGSNVIIDTVFDARQNPKKLEKKVK